ncbi:amidohydrolase family protein [Xanthobacter autotrophicus DSM 431]|uniref:amidohydrolase n=1 Tax=Xanthobacter nonsaccharivorans TaxID=3119912 RepID=UPI0037278BC1
MRNALRAAVTLLVGLSAAQAETPADFVLRNGKVYAADPARSIRSAFAVRGNTIAAVGDDEAMKPLIGPQTRVVDLGGKFVMPGLIDAHSHPVIGAVNAAKCSLAGVKPTLQEITPVIRKCLAERPGGPDAWLEVVQLYNYGFDASAKDIDTVEATRPLAIVGNDGHTMWMNTRGLALAGITAKTPDPQGGRILRDATGAPTGVLTDAALIGPSKLLPIPTTAEMADLLEKTIKGMNATGLTAVTDAALTPVEFAVFEKLYREGRLKVRVRGAHFIEDLSDDSDAAVAKIVSATRSETLDPAWLRADSVKVFADGVLEFPAQTAAVLKPYLDANGKPTATIGDLYFEPKPFNSLITKLDKAGLTVHVHAIGDRAVRASLDAFAAARAANGARDNRHQIAHLQLVDPADFARFAELGVIANVQFEWGKRDASNVGPLEPYLGPERYRYLYPYGSLRAAGALVAAGSDWDISPYDPFIAMEVGATRRDRGKDAQTLNIEERLSVADMLAGYTINAAAAMRMDDIVGSIEPGKRADFVILDRDPLAIDPSTLRNTKVLATYVDGKVVHEQ